MDPQERGARPLPREPLEHARVRRLGASLDPLRLVEDVEARVDAGVPLEGERIRGDTVRSLFLIPCRSGYAEVRSDRWDGSVVAIGAYARSKRSASSANASSRGVVSRKYPQAPT
jgi:hypothetical protein